MTKTYKTVEDCAHLWVSEFNAIPTMMVSELMNVDPDSWREVTEPSSGAVVFVAGNVGTVETVRDGEALVHLANGLCFWVPKGKCEVDYCDALPMWGTMWSFSDPCDIWWVEEGDGVEVLSRCGFRVFITRNMVTFSESTEPGIAFTTSTGSPCTWTEVSAGT